MLHTDVHSHILPGIDDGAKNIDVSEGIINRLFSQGVEYIAATPHFRSHRESVDHFLARRRKAYELLCRSLSYDVMKRITVAAEVALEYGLSDEKKLTELTYGSTKYILLELPFRQFSQRMIEEISNIQYDYDLIPVIAHIDRYIDLFGQDDYDMLLSLGGVIFQVNNTALLDKKTRRLVSRLIEENLPFVLGSDSHDTENRAPDFDIVSRSLSDYQPHPDAQRFLDALRTAGLKELESVYTSSVNNAIIADPVVKSVPQPVSETVSAQFYSDEISSDDRSRDNMVQENTVQGNTTYRSASYVNRTNLAPQSESAAPYGSGENDTAVYRRGSSSYAPDLSDVRFAKSSGSPEDLRELTDTVRKISDSLRENERSASSGDITEAASPASGTDAPGYTAYKPRVQVGVPENSEPRRTVQGSFRLRESSENSGTYSRSAGERYNAAGTAYGNPVKSPDRQRGEAVRAYDEPEINIKAFLPLLYFFAAAVIFSFVLPKLKIFDHVIDVSASDVYPASQFIGLGDEGADVTALQKKLYTLGYLDFDGVTGRYDETTASAVNSVLELRNMQPSAGCSHESYDMLLALTPQELVSGSDTAAEIPDVPDNGGENINDDGATAASASEQTHETTTTNTTTTTTATTTVPTTTTTSDETTTAVPTTTTTTTAASQNGTDETVSSNKVVRIIEENTRLRSKPKMKSTVMFWVQTGDEYTYLGEETDDEGTRWYKLQYKDVCQGYVLAEQAELVDR